MPLLLQKETSLLDFLLNIVQHFLMRHRPIEIDMRLLKLIPSETNVVHQMVAVFEVFIFTCHHGLNVFLIFALDDFRLDYFQVAESAIENYFI